MEESNTTTGTVLSEDNTTAIVAYITIIGFIVGIVLHSKNKTTLGAFHLRQMMGLIIGSIVVSFIPVVNLFAWIFFLVLWVMGLMNAINKKTTPVPVLGEYFEKWFAGAFS
jgi:uncharacterized membrane protein